MKHFIFIASIVLCLVTPLAAQNNDVKKKYEKWMEGNSFVFSTGWEYAGQHYKYNLRMDDFKGTPQWNPSMGEAPLSPDEAYRIATRELKVLVGDLTPWNVYKIELYKLPKGPDGWYYEVDFAYSPEDNLGINFTIIVRLDGKAILPFTDPKPQITRTQP